MTDSAHSPKPRSSSSRTSASEPRSDRSQVLESIRQAVISPSSPPMTPAEKARVARLCENVNRDPVSFVLAQAWADLTRDGARSAILELVELVAMKDYAAALVLAMSIETDRAIRESVMTEGRAPGTRGTSERLSAGFILRAVHAIDTERNRR